MFILYVKQKKMNEFVSQLHEQFFTPVLSKTNGCLYNHHHQHFIMNIHKSKIKLQIPRRREHQQQHQLKKITSK